MEHIQTAEAYLAESRLRIKALKDSIATVLGEAAALNEELDRTINTDRNEYERIVAVEREEGMKDTWQGEVFNHLASIDLMSHIGIAKRCTTRYEEALERFIQQAEDKFEKTLNNEQRMAFRQIQSLMSAVSLNYEERGITEGLILSEMLHTFITNPDAAFRKSTAERPPFSKAYKREIDILTAYFYVHGIEPPQLPLF